MLLKYSGLGVLANISVTGLNTARFDSTFLGFEISRGRRLVVFAKFDGKL